MCGICGVFIRDSSNMPDLEKVIDSVGLDSGRLIQNNALAAAVAYFLELNLQHRGQESAGIFSSDGKGYFYKRGMGLVKRVFSQKSLEKLIGNEAIGHNRYSTTGASISTNIQPFYEEHPYFLALGHNGNIVNKDKLKEAVRGLKKELGINNEIRLRSSTDSELLLHLAILYQIKYKKPIEEALPEALKQYAVGSYSLTVLTKDKLIGIRDPRGNRPLWAAKLGELYLLSSETGAIDRLMMISNYRLRKGDFVREVKRGEMVVVDNGGFSSIKKTIPPKKEIRCIFGPTYLNRPDHKGVYRFRESCGSILAEEHYVSADAVISAPESGDVAAIAYASRSNTPFKKYVQKDTFYEHRTFIQPYPKGREIGALIKYIIASGEIKEKRLVIVDDSIVRANTAEILIKILRLYGAKELHFRIASPPYRHPCHLGIHTPTKKELFMGEFTEKQGELYLAARFYGVDYERETLKEMIKEGMSLKDILKQSIKEGENYLTQKERGKIDDRRFSLRYLGLENYKKAGKKAGFDPERNCYACFNGIYPKEMVPYLEGKV